MWRSGLPVGEFCVFVTAWLNQVNGLQPRLREGTGRFLREKEGENFKGDKGEALSEVSGEPPLHQYLYSGLAVSKQ